MTKPSWKENVKTKVKNFLDSAPVQIFTFGVTIYALLGDDLRLIVAPIESDDTFT